MIRGKARRKEERTRRTKRFRAANPPHDHDDKTNYHDDDLIKYQWKSIHDKRLGCSKCRWSVKGCLECCPLKHAAWKKRKLEKMEPVVQSLSGRE